MRYGVWTRGLRALGSLHHPLVPNAQWRLSAGDLLAIWSERDHGHRRASISSEAAVLAEIGGADEHPGAARAKVSCKGHDLFI
jgi:hypothetical protein